MNDIVALITARGGSKGLPGKNIRLLAGKPLIQWSVEAARSAPSISRIIISSDCPDIIAAATAAGAEAPFIRPARLAGDHTPHLDVVLHALDFLQEEGRLPEALLLLQPTSPLRTSGDIGEAVRLYRELQADAVVGVTACTSHPYLTFTVNDDGRLSPFLKTPEGYLQRQRLPAAYQLNGAIYLNRVESLRRDRTFLPAATFPLLMPARRAIDIDSLEDFELAEYYLQKYPTP